MNAKQAADYLGISIHALHRLTAERRIRSRRSGQGRAAISAAQSSTSGGAVGKALAGCSDGVKRPITPLTAIRMHTGG